ncbi:DUF362 domain-containing protein [Thermodesulfobacteriota bacterium]
MMYDVALVKYRKPYESLKQAVELCGGIGDIHPGSKVFIKPNIVLWHEGVNFPKYGVITTSRLIEDMVRLLNEHGVTDISIIEGMVEVKSNAKKSFFQIAAKGLGLELLKKRYGVKIIDALKGSFTKSQLDGKKISVNTDILQADYVINMPVMKTHVQAVVSLGIKNLKGLLNTPSRKAFHNSEQVMDLHYHLSKLPGLIPTFITVIDGIYSLEMGPLYTGQAHRLNLIIASKDLISADKVGASILGFDPKDVPHINLVSKNHGRKIDLSDVNLLGKVDIDKVRIPHQWAFEQNESGAMPMLFENAGVKGIRFIGMDKTLCTYCTHFINYVVMGILTAKNENKTFDDVEILYGKMQEPTPGCKHTILVSECQIKMHSNHPAINHCIKITGCPPKKDDFIRAFEEAGIEVLDGFMDWMEKAPEQVHLKRYKDNPEFDDSFFQIS